MKRIIALTMSALLLLAMLAACGETPDAQDAQPGTSSAAESADGASAHADGEEQNSDSDTPESTDKVAGKEDMTEVEEVVEEGMVPVYAESLKDGVYPVVMKSSSSMFKADHCELVVENGGMEAVLYMTSEAYLYMFAGTAEQAAEAAESDYISLEPVEGQEGVNAFVLPLEALDSSQQYAAFSKRKEMWYDRNLLFRADSLPVEAFADNFFTTAESLGLEDGEYSVDVSLSGGSGKASVESPAILTVADGVATARIGWSSSNYDYMKIGDEQYLPVNTEGNSTFEIPVSIFDRPMTVHADTTAMSQPHEIEYTLTFDSSSLTEAK